MQEEKLLNESLKKLQKEKQQQRAIGAEKLLGPARAASKRAKHAIQMAETEKSAPPAEAPRVKGVIRGGKWSGGVVQPDS